MGLLECEDRDPVQSMAMLRPASASLFHICNMLGLNELQSALQAYV